jgi:hypothetical protein
MDLKILIIQMVGKVLRTEGVGDVHLERMKINELRKSLLRDLILALWLQSLKDTLCM